MRCHRSSRVLAVAGLLVCILALQGCTRDLDMNVSIVNGKVQLNFVTRKLFMFSQPRETCVIGVQVIDVDTSQEQWAVQSQGRVCSNTTGILVGTAPKGFKLESAPSPLISGHRYYASVVAETESGRSDTWTQP